MFNWLFKKDYKKDSKKSSAELVRELFKKIKSQNTITDDTEYVQLDKNRLKQFVKKYHQERDLAYVQDVMDCDDFAKIAQTDMVIGTNKEKFDKPIAFGLAHLKEKNGNIHMANIALTSDDDFVIYEPMNRTWTNLDNIDEVYSIRL